jgi:outer membrane protein TolC
LGVARLEIKSSRAAYYPVLSVVGNWAWQENSKRTFFDKDARWISSSYIGWRLSVPIPDAGRMAVHPEVRFL